MLKTGILNPHINSLLSRVRHTNRLVIADRGFPYWPELETIDISLVDDCPTVLQVLRAIRPVFIIGQVWMADEFLRSNSGETQTAFAEVLKNLNVRYMAHLEFKKLVPGSVGLIRTADTTQYSNIILESA